MVSEETKTKIIERVKELEEENRNLQRDLEEELEFNSDLTDELVNIHPKLKNYKTKYLFEKKINSNVRKALISGAILFGATFFVLGYLVGTKHEENYQPVPQQAIELKKEPEQKKYKTEWEEILDKAFEKYK